MRELIKKKVTRFIMRYTCQVCERQTETIIGVDYESDEEALKHVSSHFVNGWWVADDQVVCTICLAKTQQKLRALGIKLVKGFIPPVRQEVEYAVKHEMEFATAELEELEDLVRMADEEPREGIEFSPPEKEYLEAFLRRVKKLRKKLKGGA